MNTLLYFVVMAATFMGFSQVMPGFHVTGWGPALWGAVILALVNALLKPILFVLTLPLTFMTLGLFLLVLNACMLKLTARIVPGLVVDGWRTAILAALILSLVSMIWKSASREEKRKQE